MKTKSLFEKQRYRSQGSFKIRTTKGPQEINIQLIQDITQRKICKKSNPEARQIFLSTIQNFKTLKSMFDKHNMRNFEPSEKRANVSKQDCINLDYLNYLNEYNKDQRKFTLFSF
jgi:hypothetical protein